MEESIVAPSPQPSPARGEGARSLSVSMGYINVGNIWEGLFSEEEEHPCPDGYNEG